MNPRLLLAGLLVVAVVLAAAFLPVGELVEWLAARAETHPVAALLAASALHALGVRL